MLLPPEGGSHVSKGSQSLATLIRLETRELPHYALMVAAGGSKLRPIDPASCEVPDLTKPRVARDPVTQKPFCGQASVSPQCVRGASMTVDELTTALRSFVDRPIVNKTGIDGMFDISLQFAPLGSRNKTAAMMRVGGSGRSLPAAALAVDAEAGPLRQPPRTSRFSRRSKSSSG